MQSVSTFSSNDGEHQEYLSRRASTTSAQHLLTTKDQRSMSLPSHARSTGLDLLQLGEDLMHSEESCDSQNEDTLTLGEDSISLALKQQQISNPPSLTLIPE
jgi:hypothetical protein